ncbi:MAG: HAMP domain-containing sensor histidine kinase, partial [Bacteroidota bacterium]
MIALAVTILITPGSVSPDSPMSYVERTLFFVVYMGVAALFFFFTSLYPFPKKGSIARNASLTFFPALVLIGGMTYYHLRSLATGSVDGYETYESVFRVFQASLFFYAGAGFFNLLHSLRTAQTGEDRKRLQWMFWGLSLGMAPFLFFHVLPQVLFSRYLVPEEFTTVFFLLVPLSFAVSFLKHRLLDIEILINRSIVYAVLTVFAGIAFLLTVFLMISAFAARGSLGEYLLVAGGTLLIALLFNPLRKWLQRTVDESLFPARVNYRSIVRSMEELLRGGLSAEDVYRRFLDGMCAHLPVDSGVCYEVSGQGLARTTSVGGRFPSRIPLEKSTLQVLSRTPVTARPNSVVQGRGNSDPSLDELLTRTGCSLIVPIRSTEQGLHGLIALSPQRPGERFREEEVEVLVTVASRASAELERVRLQERMILEQEESRRARELSDLKTAFVSSVSHELRMPLTSIRMFAEMLRTGRVAVDRKRNEYLRIIEGESERLSRLIGTILDFSRIDRGVKTYAFQLVDPSTVIRRAADAMKYQYEKDGVRLRMSIPR